MEFKANLSGADVSKLTSDAVKSLEKAGRTVGRDIAKVARRAVLDDVKRSRRGGLRFGRSRLGARSKVEPRGNRVDITLTATPAGFWAITEYGSVAHEIRPRQAKVLAFDDRFAMSVSHPGTTGFRFWAGAESALERAVTPVVEDEFDEAMGVTG